MTLCREPKATERVGNSIIQSVPIRCVKVLANLRVFAAPRGTSEFHLAELLTKCNECRCATTNRLKE